MFKSLVLAATAATIAFAPTAQAQKHRVIGQETSIAFASNGGIRNWERGPRGSNLLYLQDRTLRWYQVQLNGPCLDLSIRQTLIYQTDPLGRLDTFSTISSADRPQIRCQIKSIKTSLAPPQQKSRKSRRG